ncbi:alpha/beta fold hydrolase [Arthrobacter sp. VKM Ac-2550]|uniref:alpha/beta fold hydrolase n=1 Tax=Crystallibacter permensis TaxID=1938888 RepID=UPI002226F8FB|nr:alpha/beta hydrolase [Arthrobacter sp. VKM Ac-2550]MCW2134272.1 Pimeloyl-ACP methyl ester carboxylesterase [Arthrobacter sp. VKM Ac-2550]
MPKFTCPDGLAVAYRTSGQGAPLLLLSGQGNGMGWWDPIVADFESDHLVIRFDYPGTGGSDTPAAGYTLGRFADDAAALLDHLGIESSAVYGTSMGGKVAQQLALRHPSRVSALVIGCSSTGGPNTLRMSKEIGSRIADPETKEAVLTDLMYSPAWTASHPRPYATLGEATTPQARLGHQRASNGHDAWDQLGAISVPTLVLHGSDDLMVPPANADLLADRIPNAQVRIIPGGRHAYFEECREVASPIVLDFLAGVLSMPSGDSK